MVRENSQIETGRNDQLTAFVEWLEEYQLASEKGIPHYARWVRRFLRFRARRRQEAWQDSLQAFLDALAFRRGLCGIGAHLPGYTTNA